LNGSRRSQSAQAVVPPVIKTLLFVGPKPPPIGGSPLTVQAMLGELAFYPGVRVVLINTSPYTDVRHNMLGFKFEKVKRTFAIVPQFLRHIRASDATLVFANELFAITLAPVLLVLARLYGKPFFLKPVGAGLDLYIERRSKPLRAYLLKVLRSTDAVLTQTRLLEADLTRLGCANARYLPGCRPPTPSSGGRTGSQDEFKVVFLGHITRQKGPFILLEALDILSRTCMRRISCDFYGPIHHDCRDEFLEGLRRVKHVEYRGMVEAGASSQVISNYDVLVLPTSFKTEGHPGVLIEAMQAGVPVISTQIRTIFELVTDGQNGFLVPPEDPSALADAIRRLALDPGLWAEMAEANRRRGHEFRADVVVAQLLKIIFPQASLRLEGEVPVNTP
jgi:glycosyltransferase involved in cell wall biosynthesis